MRADKRIKKTETHPEHIKSGACDTDFAVNFTVVALAAIAAIAIGYLGYSHFLQ